MGNRALTRGAGLGLLAVASERLISFLLLLYLARALTTAEFGLFGFVFAGLALVQAMADQGVEAAATRAMSSTPSRQAALLGLVIGIRVGLWACVGVPVALIVLPRLGGVEATSAGFLASLYVLLGASLSYRSLYRARQQLSRVLWIALVNAVVTTGAVIGVVHAGFGVDGAFGARALASVAVTAVIAFAARPALRIARPRFPEDRALVGALGSAAWPLALNAVLIALSLRAGHLVSMAIVGPTEVGYLSAAARVAEGMSLLPEGVMLAVFPVMAAAPERALAVAAAFARRLSFAVLCLVVVGAVGAAEVTTLLFGPDYAAAGPALRVLVWGALLGATGSAILHSLIAAGHQRLLLWTNIAASATGVALQLVLVPRFGIVGAAAATLVALAAGQVYLALSPAGRPSVWVAWRAAAPPIALAAVVVAALLLLPSGWWRLCVAGVAYPVLGWALGFVDASDWRTVREALRGSDT